MLGPARTLWPVADLRRPALSLARG